MLFDLELSLEAREELQAIIERRLDVPTDPRKGIGLILDAPEIPFRERQEFCPQRLKNRSLIVEEVGWIRQELVKRDVVPPARVDLLLYIDHRGAVRHVRPNASTGDRWLDEELVKLGYRLRWEPARINDIPITAWAAQPILF